MNDSVSAFSKMFELIVGLDPDFIEIVSRSLFISFTAVLASACVGLPLGAALAILDFPGRRALTVVLNALMGLPPVVVGLSVYLLLSRSGPLGALGLLFTPTAMVLAQTALVTPIVAALTRQIIEDLWGEYREQLTSLGATPAGATATLLWDARFSLVTVLLAGFGRASSEVGAVMIVGGNIQHHTRVMTTAIALETSRGDLALALGLGLVLIGLSLAVNGAAFMLRERMREERT